LEQFFSAERLNLYLDRQECDDDEEREEEAVDESLKKKKKKKKRDEWKQNSLQNLRIVLPHVGLVILSATYTLLGAAIFHHYEKPFEEYLRNETAHRVHSLKQRIIDDLWEMNRNGTPYTLWAERAQIAMDDIIRDVFIDYTRNYMTPEDVITGSGPFKWSFGSSVFFSWTAITTIGYGHIVPRTNAGRIAIIFYALFGIPLILVTIADMGRFLSGGIIWVHNTYRNFMDACYSQCWKCIKCMCCRFRQKQRRIQLTFYQSCVVSKMPTIELLQKQRQMYGTVMETRKAHDNRSEAGTFEDISEIQTHISEHGGGPSEDTRALAEELEPEVPHHERRVSVVFILIVMLGKSSLTLDLFFGF
uniref:Ion_trans_2 domain-containing protein n=1 Tax=Angiostrongylus costaricensis TaxID=334426 RepID=A0A158PET2_ANGCS